MSEQPDEPLMTVKEVAAMLRVSEDWVRKHSGGHREPVLPRVKMGDAVRFRRRDVREFLQQMAGSRQG